MEKFFDGLRESKLFCGLNDIEIERFLTCSKHMFWELNARDQIDIDINYSIFVIKGEVMTFENTWSGNKIFINRFTPQGNALIAVSKKHRYPSVIIEAKIDSVLLLLETDAFTKINIENMYYQNIIQQNIINIFYDMTDNVLQRTIVTAERNSRSKILKYLYGLLDEQGYNTVKIPISRNELAAHLSVDVSTLTRELNALKQDGIINFNRDFVTVLDTNYTAPN